MQLVGFTGDEEQGLGSRSRFNPHPKGPCTQIGDTSAPKYPNRDQFKAQVYTI